MKRESGGKERLVILDRAQVKTQIEGLWENWRYAETE